MAFSQKIKMRTLGWILLGIPCFGLANVIYTVGAIPVESGAGMTSVDGKPWSFFVHNYEPYTKPIDFPQHFDVASVSAVGIEIEKDKVQPGERMTLFLILDNGKGVTAAQRQTAVLKQGRHNYLFDTAGLPWFKGRLSGIRLDPGSSPGAVSLYSIGVYSETPVEAKESANIIVHAKVQKDIGLAADTFFETGKVRYRLTSDSIDFSLLESFENRQKVLKLGLYNPANEAKVLSLSFASTNARVPFSPIIPPYVGLRAEGISLTLWTDSPSQLEDAFIRVRREDGRLESSGENTLKLRIKNLSAEQFHVMKDSPEGRDKMEKLKKQRSRLFPYSLDLSRN